MFKYYLRRFLKYLRTIVIISVVISAIVGLICWLMGYNTLGYYCNGLFFAGGTVLILGCFSAGGSRSKLKFDHNCGRISINMNPNFKDTLERDEKEETSGINFAITAIGVFAILGTLSMILLTM